MSGSANPLTVEGIRIIHARDRFTFRRGAPSHCGTQMHELERLVDDREPGRIAFGRVHRT